MVDGKLHGVVRRRKVHIIHPSIRFLQLALLIRLVFEELILVLCYSCVDKDVVDRAKPLNAGFESFALASPICEIALQSEDAFGFDECFGGLLWIGFVTI
jgi:hypothetical protein